MWRIRLVFTKIGSHSHDALAITRAGHFLHLVKLLLHTSRLATTKMALATFGTQNLARFCDAEPLCSSLIGLDLELFFLCFSHFSTSVQNKTPTSTEVGVEKITL